MSQEKYRAAAGRRRAEPIDFRTEKQRLRPQKGVRKKKKISRKKLRRLLGRILGLGLVALVCGVIFMAVPNTESIRVKGNSLYDDSEIITLVLGDRRTVNPLRLTVEDRLRSHRKIPFLESYRVVRTGLRSVEIRVEEKAITGYAEVMGTRMYFDNTGLVTEATQEVIGSVPRVQGLSGEGLALGEKVPGVRTAVFTELQSINRVLNGTTLTRNGKERCLMEHLDYIRMDSGKEVTLVFGDVSVALGGSDYIEEKLREMISILPELDGRRGTLHLESYDPKGEKRFRFA